MAEGTTSAPTDAAGRYTPGMRSAYDGNWYYVNANAPVTILASAARTATPTIDNMRNTAYASCHVVMDITAGSTLSIVVTILGYDPVSTKTWTLLASSSLTGTGTTILKIGKGLTASANAVANDILPAYLAFTVVHSNANSATYTLTFHGLIN